MKRWPVEIKNKARKSRHKGASFSEITRKLKVPKSTLSVWLSDISKPNHLAYTNQKEWLKKIRVLAIKANKKKRQRIKKTMIKEVREDIKDWKNIKDIRTQKIILAFLYWAEGSKGNVVVFANTDPRLSLLFITLLRNSFKLDESKFRVRLHLHYYHREKETKAFWSQLLAIPQSQFTKTYRKRRSRNRTFRRNFGGICFVKYNSVYLQRRIMQYAYTIAEKLIGEVKVPVV